MKKYIKLLRPHHYVKNMLIFCALVCSGQFFESARFLRGLWGFLAFCAVSSAIYILNDIRDVEQDRQHPTKCKRPIASGAVPVNHAWCMAALLLLIGLGCNLMVQEVLPTALLLLYVVLNLGYSMGLKQIPIVDISILVSGFLIRMVYGALITQIVISNWLYLTVVALAFYFALGKRRNELQRQNGQTRHVLKYYPINFLNNSMTMCLTLVLTFYALWSMDENTVQSYGTGLVMTLPIVMLIILKYSLQVEGNSDGDPVEVLMHDKILMGLCLVYFAVMFLVLYM